MNKTTLILFSSLLIVSGLFGINDPANSLQWIFATNPVFDTIRFGIATGLILIALYPSSKDHGIHVLLKSIGISFIAISIIGIFTPTFFGMNEYFVFPFDLFLSMQTGIVCLLTVLDMQDTEEAEKRYRTISQRLFIKEHTEESEEKAARLPAHTSNI